MTIFFWAANKLIELHESSELTKSEAHPHVYPANNKPDHKQEQKREQVKDSNKYKRETIANITPDK